LGDFLNHSAPTSWRTKVTEDIPQWAKEEAVRLANAEGANVWTAQNIPHHSIGRAFARYIAKTMPEPVDPLREEALQLVLNEPNARNARWSEAIRTGQAGQERVALALSALRRGMELAAAKAASTDPYGPPIPHDGGPCSYPDEVGLVQFRDGSVRSNNGVLDLWRWGHAGYPTDIIAYRLRSDHPHYKGEVK
jgi:hypothetical protein